MTALTAPAELMEAALACAARGWPVAPAFWIMPDGRCVCKKACTSPGKHPITPRGLHDATTNERQLRAWWEERPHANLLVPTGAISGFDVLDVDPRRGGDDTLHHFERELGELPDTVECITGSGGRHLYFRHAEGLKNSAGLLGEGLDVRADGGYVLVPPSNHSSRRLYAWELSSHPDEVALASWPEALLERLRTAPGPEAAPAEPGGVIPEGKRNQRLTALAGAARRQGATEAELLALLREVNEARCAPPLDDPELVQIAQSLTRYAPSPDPVFLKLQRQTDGELCRETQEPENTPDFTDEGNLERLLLRWGTELRHCRDLAGKHPMDGGWYLWDGVRWQKDRTRKIGSVIRDTLNAIADEPAVLGPLKRDGECDNLTLRWFQQCRTDQRRTALANVAISAQEIALMVDDLDTHAWKLNCKNGSLDLRTGELREPERDDLLTQQIPVAFDPEASCPLWHTFLDEILEGDQELVRFLQKAFGYALTGSTEEQCVFILYGGGHNGKSKLVETIGALLGDYAATAESSTFMVRTDSTVRNDLAALRSARYVTAIETSNASAGRKELDEALIKRLSGDDTITARFLYSEYFTYKPQFKIFLATNHEPVIRGMDYGIWRRIRFVPFEVKIPPEKRDKKMGEKLLTELPGILNWCLAGCLLWQEEGLEPPAKVEEATAHYRAAMDTLGDFFDEYFEEDASAVTTFSSIYDCYLKWAAANNERAETRQKLGSLLTNRGFKTTTLSRSKDRARKGLRLKASA